MLPGTTGAVLVGRGLSDGASAEVASASASTSLIEGFAGAVEGSSPEIIDVQAVVGDTCGLLSAGGGSGPEADFSTSDRAAAT